MKRVVVLDAGALIALERGDALVRQYVLIAAHGRVRALTSSGVVAQVFRGGSRQARIGRILRSEVMEEVALDAPASRRIGLLAAKTRARDVVDGHVAVLALDHDGLVLTSDAKDMIAWGVAPSRIVNC